MEAALQSMINNMPEKTGKSLEEWIQILSQNQMEKHSQMVKFLKDEFGVSHGFANTIVHLFNTSEEDEEDMISKQYEGKETLKPIFMRLEAIITSLGSDIEFAPKKTYVSARRKKQFAILQPSTKSRFDLGLNLKGKEPQGALEPSGSFNAMCSHRIKIEHTKEINAEVIKWIKVAYEMAG